jgi:hypothetical protein
VWGGRSVGALFCCSASVAPPPRNLSSQEPLAPTGTTLACSDAAHVLACWVPFAPAHPAGLDRWSLLGPTVEPQLRLASRLFTLACLPCCCCTASISPSSQPGAIPTVFDALGKSLRRLAPRPHFAASSMHRAMHRPTPHACSCCREAEPHPHSPAPCCRGEVTAYYV